MPALVTTSTNRISGIFSVDSNSVIRNTFRLSTSEAYDIYPYGSYITWFNIPWYIGDSACDGDIEFESGYHTFNCGTTATISVYSDVTYDATMSITNKGHAKGSYMSYGFTSTLDMQLKLYVTGLCKANSNTNLSLSYAYALDGGSTIPHNYDLSVSLTTEWKPFIYEVDLISFGTSNVSLVPVTWSGTYLYGPQIKDIQVMLVNSQLSV